MGIQTIDDVLQRVAPGRVSRLPAPAYRPRGDEERRPRVGMAVASMRDHMTDEGWQIYSGLEYAGYTLCGGRLCTWIPGDGAELSLNDLGQVLSLLDPSTVVVQDKREWEGKTAGGPRGFDDMERLRSVEVLAGRDDVFRLTILKDAQSNPDYHRQAAEEMGAHAWVVYYHPRIVAHLAPYVRPEHLVRTYHSLDPEVVPTYSSQGRRGAVLSGAVSGAYPLRARLVASLGNLPLVEYLRHPGYHRAGCVTPDYLRTLAQYRVAICTSSVYGYALRKIIEATAAGCRVVTDLPADEVLPAIDGNLVRIPPETTADTLAPVLADMYRTYDPEAQYGYAVAATSYYDYRAVGCRLAEDVETLRRNYAVPQAVP